MTTLALPGTHTMSTRPLSHHGMPKPPRVTSPDRPHRFLGRGISLPDAHIGYPNPRSPGPMSPPMSARSFGTIIDSAPSTPAYSPRMDYEWNTSTLVLLRPMSSSSEPSSPTEPAWDMIQPMDDAQQAPSQSGTSRKKSSVIVREMPKPPAIMRDKSPPPPIMRATSPAPAIIRATSPPPTIMRAKSPAPVSMREISPEPRLLSSPPPSKRKFSLPKSKPQMQAAIVETAHREDEHSQDMETDKTKMPSSPPPTPSIAAPFGKLASKMKLMLRRRSTAEEKQEKKRKKEKEEREKDYYDPMESRHWSEY
jgi:hypothetical protein